MRALEEALGMVATAGTIMGRLHAVEQMVLEATQSGPLPSRITVLEQELV